jgi:uncharacterized membrane protein YgcG
MPIGFGAEEEAYAYRTGRAAPAPPSIVGDARTILNQKLQAANLANNQQRIATGVNVPQASGVGYWAPISQNMAPIQLPPPPEQLKPLNQYQDPYFKNSANDPFRAFQLSPLAQDNQNVMTGFDLFTKDRATTTYLYDNMTAEEKAKAEEKSRENRAYVARKERVVKEVENVQAKDPNLPAAEREALNAIKLELSQMKAKDVNNDLNPIIVALRNLGTRAQYRIEFSAWKKNKSAGTSMALPQALPTTAEEFDQVGGLGGFLTQGSTTKTAGDFDRTPAIFGKLITRDENGVETIITAEDWIAARIADTKPLPNDTPEERRRKEKLAADWIATLAFADKYNSFAQKRDAGYRVQLDSNGNPVRAYFLKPDEDALKNLAGEILSDMGTHNIVGPIEDWIQAYAEARNDLAADATGIFGTGQSSSGNSGSGYYGGGGYRGGGGGGGGGYSTPTTYYPTEAEVLEPAEGVARARLGRGLTDEEKADFVSFFRGIEASVLAAGGMLARLDPQAQAIVWLQSKLDEEARGQQSGRYVVALMNAFRSGNLNVS